MTPSIEYMHDHQQVVKKVKGRWVTSPGYICIYDNETGSKVIDDLVKHGGYNVTKVCYDTLSPVSVWCQVARKEDITTMVQINNSIKACPAVRYDLEHEIEFYGVELAMWCGTLYLSQNDLLNLLVVSFDGEDFAAGMKRLLAQPRQK